MARPTKFTPELQKKICDAIRAGAYIETAAAYAGIDKTTLYDWLRRSARDKSGIYTGFSHAVEKALAEAEMRDLIIIGKAAEENWQAAAWRLERKFPDRWGRKDRVSATLKHTGEVTTKHEQHYHIIQQVVAEDEAIADRLLSAFERRGSP
jgi:hypothetical protein